jgi:lipoyl(octanoyl) transferase
MHVRGFGFLMAGRRGAAGAILAWHMRTVDLGLISYRQAWEVQEEMHAQVLAGGEEVLLVLEHTPVITFGRRVADAQRNLLASAEVLARVGVEVVESDRGGDITYHGPGQLVAYPIVRLIDHRLSVGAYVRRLEDVVIATLGEFGIEGFKDDSAIGVWVNVPGAEAAKICALGVRIKRGVTLHGIALNLATDLSHFGLINPCGLGRPVTSMGEVLGERAPGMGELKESFARHAVAALG